MTRTGLKEMDRDEAHSLGELKACSTLTLLAEARAGNELADEILCERYWTLARQIVRGRLPASARGHMDTEDIVQDLFLKILPLSSFDAHHSGALRGFFKKSLLHRLIDQYRAAGRRPGVEPLHESFADRRNDLWDILVQNEALDRYDEAVGRLGAREQKVVIARVELGLTFGEIARELSIGSTEAARAAFRRAFKKVAREVIEGGPSASRSTEPEAPR